MERENGGIRSTDDMTAECSGVKSLLMRVHKNVLSYHALNMWNLFSFSLRLIQIDLILSGILWFIDLDMALCLSE